MVLRTVQSDIFTLAELLRAEWPAVHARIRESGHPTCEGEPDPDPDPDPTPPAPEPEPEPEPAPEPIKPDDSWQSKARKHERDLKKERKAREELEAKLAEFEQSKLSEQEKAIAKAREEAKAEVSSEYEKARRADRLEVAVMQIATSKGVSIGDGDDAKTVKFTDPDDVQTWVERQIARGELDAEDIFEQGGKVNRDALMEVLTDLAKDKPHWLTTNGNASTQKPAGDSDAGKGKPKLAGNESFADHLKAVQKR